MNSSVLSLSCFVSLFLAFLGPISAFAVPLWDSRTVEASLDGRLASELQSPHDLSSQRLGVQFSQRINFSDDWKLVNGFRAWWDEGVYSTRSPQYSSSEARQDSRELRLRDLYIQYQSGDLQLRAGNQQVVWGEAFGYFYSDIVNPKDLRDGLFGDLTDIRMQTPLLQAKWTRSEFTAQALVIPKPYFSLLPSPGSNFAYPFSLPVGTVQIQREESLPLSPQNTEAGGRISRLFGHLDVSAFYLYSFDRNPYYALNSATNLPQTLVADEHHSRVHNVGLTATNDFDGYVVRAEALATLDRTLPSIIGATLTTVQANNYIYVLGVDLPTWEQFSLGTQWSQDILTGSPQGLLRHDVQSLISLRLQRPLFGTHSAELLYSYAPNDAGNRTQLTYVLPMSGDFETRFGMEIYGGPSSSDLGKFHDASRGFAVLKYYLRPAGAG